MSKNGKHKVIKTVAFIVFSTLLFLVIIFSLYKINFMDFIEFIPSLFEKDDDPPLSAPAEKIKSLISLLEKNDGTYESIGLDGASAVAMLSAVPVDDSYYHTYSVKYLSDTDIAEKNIFVTKEANAWAIIERQGTITQKTVRFDGDWYVVKDDLTGEENKFSKNSGMSFDGENYLTPISEIKALMSEYENAQKNGTSASVTDVSAEIVRTQTDNVIFVSFTYADTGIREEYMIHLDWGVILVASAYHDGKEYYKVTTNVFDPNYKTN